MSFLNSVINNSKKFDDPFQHWELDKPLTDEQINEIITADIQTRDNGSPLRFNAKGLYGVSDHFPVVAEIKIY